MWCYVLRVLCILVRVLYQCVSKVYLRCTQRCVIMSIECFASWCECCIISGVVACTCRNVLCNSWSLSLTLALSLCRQRERARTRARVRARSLSLARFFCRFLARSLAQLLVRSGALSFSFFLSLSPPPPRLSPLPLSPAACLQQTLILLFEDMCTFYTETHE
jgi:hypothetical protein